MGTTIDDLKHWYEEGKRQKARWMIVVCDTFSYEDYPSYVKTVEEFEEEMKEYRDGANMQRVMEVYDLELPFDQGTVDGPAQHSAKRAWNGPKK